MQVTSLNSLQLAAACYVPLSEGFQCFGRR